MEISHNLASQVLRDDPEFAQVGDAALWIADSLQGKSIAQARDIIQRASKAVPYSLTLPTTASLEDILSVLRQAILTDCRKIGMWRAYRWAEKIEDASREA